MKHLWPFGFIIILGCTGYADAVKKNPKESNSNAAPVSFDHSHASWDDILKKYVVEKGPAATVFRYKALKKAPANFNAYLRQLSSVETADYSSWSKNQKVAFLINAYNAFTVKLILDEMPVDSIKDIGGWFGSPWKREFFELLGKSRTLHWIEHDMLRPKFKEPRIHFAINCASVGCPKLRKEAYVPDKIEQQMEEQTKDFLQDTSRNRLDLKDKELHISPIFKWFDEDFEKKSGSVQAFVAKYITDDTDVRSQLKAGKFDVKYTDYDWALND